MTYTPVELRHIRLPRGLLGYRRDAVERVLDEVAESFEVAWRERGEFEDKVEELEKAVEEHRRREELLAQALVSAEQTASDVRDRAKQEAELIVAEAHQEARSIVRGAQSEQARLAADARRVEVLLRTALGTFEESARAPAAEDESEDEAKREPWPRREDTREFPRNVHPVPGPAREPEAQAG
jgi:cell division initiation protein